jgi:uncharacterized membrane protein YdjX (TVP38/TMEM64 family)
MKAETNWIIPVVLVVSLIAMYFLWPDFQDFSNRAYSFFTSGEQERIRNWVESFGFWGPLIIFALMICQTLFPIIPSILIMVVAVLAYGPIWGGLLAWGGLAIAALVAYSIGRALGPVTVYKLIGEKTEQKVENLVKRYGFWGIIAARLSPVLSTDAASYTAGLVKMGFLRFFAATVIGILPLTALISFLSRDIDRLNTTLIWLSITSAAIFIGYMIYDHFIRRQRGQSSTSEAS